MSTKSSSSSRSKFSRFIPSNFCHYPVVCGLLGTTRIKYGSDFWMGTDFVVLRELIGAHEDRSIWLCGTPIRKDSFLLGDPVCDRIVFVPPPFEAVYEEPPIRLRTRYLLEVGTRAATLSRKDILVLVLVGHGERDGVFIIGDDNQECKLRKPELEECVRGTKGTIWLINTACHSREWESPHWFLFAATEADQEVPSIAVSGSDKVRRGFFVNALLAEYANEFNLTAPCPASVDEHGHRGQQRPHDFGPDKSVRPSCSSPKRSLHDVCEWINHWRDHIGRVYTSANVCFRPCPVSKPNSIPFRSLEFQTAALHRFQCIPPSTPGDETSYSSVNVKSVGLSLAHSSMQPTSKLSPEDEMQLTSLAQDLLWFRPIQTATETETIIRCCRVLRGDGAGNPLSEAERCSLFSELKSRKRCQEFAVAIAKNLGWGDIIDKLGRPDGEQARLSVMLGLQRKAEANGCLVNVLIRREHSIRPYMGAAGWLARIWEAAGHPSIASPDWELAVGQSLHQLGPSNSF